MASCCCYGSRCDGSSVHVLLSGGVNRAAVAGRRTLELVADDLLAVLASRRLVAGEPIEDRQQWRAPPPVAVAPGVTAEGVPC